MGTTITFESKRVTRRPRSLDPGVKQCDTIEGRLRRIIADVICTDENEVTPKSLFVEDLDADFLDRVEIVMAIEESFSITMGDAEGESIVSLETAMSVVERRMM